MKFFIKSLDLERIKRQGRKKAPIKLEEEMLFALPSFDRKLVVSLKSIGFMTNL